MAKLSTCSDSSNTDPPSISRDSSCPRTKPCSQSSSPHTRPQRMAPPTWSLVSCHNLSVAEPFHLKCTKENKIISNHFTRLVNNVTLIKITVLYHGENKVFANCPRRYSSTNLNSILFVIKLCLYRSPVLNLRVSVEIDGSEQQR